MRVRSVVRGSLALFAVLGLSLAIGCGPTYPECDNDDHCADYSEFCVNKKCRACRDDSHCNATDACKVCGAGYTCVKRPGCCHSDLDCPTGVCRKADGAETGDCFGNCKNDGNCPPNQKCEGNMCVPKAECTGPGQCGPDKECKDGRCVDKCRAEAIHFDYNEYKIRLDAKPVLERNVECIQKRAQSFTVEGHCDERGTDEYNMALGSRRAQAAKKYLKRLGISKDLMGTISYGEEQPVCGGHSEDCWWRNRRAEFSFK